MDNTTVLYGLAILVFIYIIAFRVKENLENSDLANYTEEQLRLLINKAGRSKERLDKLIQIQDPPEYIKKRIGEMHEDIKNAEIATQTLISRNIVV